VSTDPPSPLAHPARRGVGGPGSDVEISMSADPEMHVLARLTASAYASRFDFDLDDIEDLRLAVGELCIACSAGATAASRLTLRFAYYLSSLRVECTVTAVASGVDDDAGNPLLGGLSPGELSRRILAELVDAYRVEPAAAGVRRGSIEMRRRAAGS
jgi:serine/threonine-protein kinase RsbW